MRDTSLPDGASLGIGAGIKATEGATSRRFSELSSEDFDLTIIEKSQPQTSISRSEIADETKCTIAARPPVSHTDVWHEILDALEPIDFREEAELDEDGKILQKHHIVITVREVLRVARSLDCGLCRNYDFIYAYNGAFWKLTDKETIADFPSNMIQFPQARRPQRVKGGFQSDATFSA